MDVATTMATLTRTTACPACGANRLEFLLRCDLGSDGSCLYTAHCRDCEDTFEIVTTRPNRDRDLHRLRRAVRPCPVCGCVERDVAMSCDVTTHQCVLVLQCTVCGRARR